MREFLKLFWVLLIVFPSAVYAQTIAPYGQVKDGSIRLGNLEWLRCSYGQSWNGRTCIGEAREFDFAATKLIPRAFNRNGYGGHRDWRLPSIRELQTLRYCSKGFIDETRSLRDGAATVKWHCVLGSSTPTLDTISFPATPVSWFWSSSVHSDDGIEAWFVSFNLGAVGYGTVAAPYYVRLVRDVW